MADLFVAPERQETDSDPYSFHQGSKGADVWDPFGFHQKGDQNKTPKPNLPDRVEPRPDLPLPPIPEAPKRIEVRLPDGALNVKDELGRVVLTVSADGSKSRGVEYGDPNDPSKVTKVVIDNQRVYTRNQDGRSWTCEVNGHPCCTWYGDVRMNQNGEYFMEDHRTGERRHFGANTKEIVDENTRAAQRRGGCGTGECYPQPRRSGYDYRSGSCYPQQDYNRNQQDYYRNQQDYYRDQRDYYRNDYYRNDRQPYCDPRQDYYRRQDHYWQQQEYQRRQQQYYQQQRYYNSGCNSGFGPAFVSSMIGSAMPYRGGWGYQPGYYRGGNIGGNIAGAVVGSVINRAIWGGGRRYCR